MSGSNSSSAVSFFLSFVMSLRSLFTILSVKRPADYQPSAVFLDLVFCQDFVEPLEDQEEQPQQPASEQQSLTTAVPVVAASEPVTAAPASEEAIEPAKEEEVADADEQALEDTPAVASTTEEEQATPAVGVASAAPIAAPTASQEPLKTVEPGGATTTASSAVEGDATKAPLAAAVAKPTGVIPPTATEITPAPVTATSSSQQEEEEPARRSFKDRLAAFNAPASPGGGGGGSRGPPPPIKPKPAPAAGSWAWKQKQQQQAESSTSSQQSEVAAPGAAPAATTASSTLSGDQQQQTSSGMSASDAKESITKGGMSLKERMAALQQASAAPQQTPAPGGPPAVGAKPRVWKRPEAPPAPAPTSPVATTTASENNQPPLAVASTGGESTENIVGAESGDVNPEKGSTEPSVEDEERADRERRAAIAARMQRLGARGMGVGGAFGGATAAAAAAPAAAPKKVEAEQSAPKSEDVPPQEDADKTVLNDEVIEKESTKPEAFAPSTTAADPVATSPGVGATSIAMPAIPKRAGPPKRRGGAPAPTRSDSKASTTSSVTEPTTPAALHEMSRQEVPETQNPQFAEPDVSGGPDVEIPKPKDDEERRLDREAEDLGQGPRGAEGAIAAGIPVAAVMQAEHGDAPSTKDEDEKDEEFTRSSAAAQDDDDADQVPVGAPSTVAPKSSLPPPPPPAGGFSDDEQSEADDEDDDDVDIMKQASAGGLKLQPSQRDVDDGLDESSDAPTTRNISSPAERAAGMQELGLPKDEVALKEEQAAPESDDEAAPPPPPARPISMSSPPSKPAGPRPLLSTPERQAVLPQPTQVGVPLPADESKEPQQEEQQAPSPVMTEEPAADPDAQRRAGIAARMAKLGGIKLGGPPMMPMRRGTNESLESPRSPMSPGAEPTSPIKETNPMPAIQQAGDEEEEEEETEEAAARRRQATLARLQAGGSLGQGMFGGPKPVQEAAAEAEKEEPPAESAPLPVPEQPVTEEAAAEEVEEEEMENEQDEEDAPPPAPPMRTLPSQVPSSSQDEEDISEDDEPPPPPPVRPAQRQASIPAPPVVEAARKPDEELHAPIETPASLTAEPEEETEEQDEPPPPPPPRDIQRSNTTQSRTSISSPTTPSFGQIQRSETAQSRSSISSDNASARRPGYNELQSAATQFGQRVLTAVNKLAGKRGATVGVSTQRAELQQSRQG